MDKNTLLAVVLSVIVISVGFYIQSTFFMPPVEERSGGAASQDGGGGDAGQTKAAGQAETTAQSAQGGAAEKSTGADGAEEAPTETIRIAPGASSNIRPHGEDPVQQEVRVENEVFIVNFSSRGAVATSIKLKDHLEEGRPLEMVQNEGSGLGTFGIAFGEAYDGYTDASFHVRRIDDLTVEFYRDFSVPSTEGRPVPFTLTKRFSFKPRDYLIELRVGVKNSINAYPPLDFDGYAYTLSYGPEIGPAIEELDGRYEYRRFYSFGDGKRNKLKVKGDELITERVSWIALLGKYFTVIGIPDATKYDITASEKTIDGMKHSHQLFFSRPLIKSSVNEDIFQFYAGPKLNRVLTRYNDPDSNGFGTSDLQLEEVMDTGSILGWLEWLLKKLLMFFHSLVPNWGVAIILMTIAIKIILFPITHKSYESTSRMQSLNPKIQEIRSQYKDNPQKMNQEMAALYKTEGVNPLGGCLPLLLQMPIFIALYGLLNKHFDLRGAVFIQGWISDLSSPESIFSLPFQIPIVGWTDIRLLPIIFALTMLISSKMMQSPATSSQGNMKMIMYFMPLFLFFVLYDAPSGLLVYWIMTNFLTVIQQKVIGKRQMAHDAAGDDSGGGGGSGASGDGGGRPKAAAKTGPGGGKAKNNRSYRDEVNRRYAIAKQNRTKKKKKR